MANVLSLAMRINADASGFRLDPVQRALVNLGNEAEKLTGAFGRFAGSSEAAARAQERTAEQAQALISSLRDGAISSTQFAAQFERLSEAVDAEAAAFERAAKITEANLTQFDRFARTQAELNDQVQAGRISQETYNRAIEAAAKGLTDAERAAAGLAAIDREAEAAAQAAADAEAARAAAAREAAAIVASVATDEERRQQRLAKLQELLDSGALSEETYRRAVEQASGVQAEAARAEQERQRVLDEGKRVTEQFATVEEKRAAELAKLQRLLDQGAISEETFAKAAAEASGANAAAAAAERERADILRRAAQITEQNLTPLERYDAALVELNAQLAAGNITHETYTRATERAAKGMTDAERAARGLGAATADAGDKTAGTTLKFNELSGIFSALPGPLGSIAGRISGLSSAGEGLARIFSGGVSQGVANLGSSLGGLLTSVNTTALAIGAFGAAAAAVAQGLLSLEDRVERLGNIADKLGVSFGFIQTLEESARRSGTSIEAVSAAFGRLQRSVLGVDEESKAAQRSLAELGVTTEELQTLSPEQQYQRIGEALASIEDPARRTATATALFGRAGAELIPFFNNLPGTVEDFDRLGRALTAIDRRRIDEFGAALDGLQVASQGLGQSLLLPFVGFGEGITNALAEITAGITSIVDPIGRILEPILTQIGRVVDVLGTSLGNLGRIVGAVFEPFAVVVETVSAALEPLLDGISEFLKSIGDGAVRVTEWVVSFTPIGQIAENVGALGETVSRVVTIITTAFGKVGEFIGALVRRFGELIAQSPLIQTLGKILSSVFGSISSVFQTIANAVGGVVGRLLTMAERFLGIDNSAKKAAESTTTLGETVTTLTDEEAKQAAERDKFLQGFTDNVSKAIDESAKFGQAGFDAALQYQNSIEELQRQFDKGILNETSFRRAAEQANQAYQEQINTIKQAAAETERKAKAEAAAVQSIIDANLEQMRVDSQFGGDTQRARAADNLIKLQQEQLRVEEQIRQARESGDLESVNALTARLATIDQVAAREQDIASGAKKQREEAARAAEEAAKEAERASKQRAEAESRIREQIAEKEQQLFERQAEIRADQLAELASPRTGSVKIGDIREGGISQFFATLQEDPAISEAKKSRAELEKIRKEIAKLNAEKVDILGAPA